MPVAAVATEAKYLLAIFLRISGSILYFFANRLISDVTDLANDALTFLAKGPIKTKKKSLCVQLTSKDVYTYL